MGTEAVVEVSEMEVVQVLETDVVAVLETPPGAEEAQERQL